jgi:predicted metalloprotease with PDZ domain
VNFHVNPGASLASFKQDWTAVHEFSHLYLPYVGKSDIWISEGFASYYQNLLMARAGTLSEHKMWQKLSEGFDRGSRDKNRHLTLGELSPQMRQRRAFMRVYWSGALYFLEMDIALHQTGTSLDAVVTEFIACCRTQHKTWSGNKLVKSFDEIAGNSLFSSTYAAYESEKIFRDYAGVLSQLGVELHGKQVVFSKDSNMAKLRRQITTTDR